MKITCPYCGERDHSEFSYLGDASLKRPHYDPENPSDDANEWLEYVYMRDNPCGIHYETWQHISGCRACLVVKRNIQTHEVFGSALPSDLDRLKGTL